MVKEINLDLLSGKVVQDIQVQNDNYLIITFEDGTMLYAYSKGLYPLEVVAEEKEND